MTTLALPPTSIDALRDELARTRAHLAEYVGYEPTLREEMDHIRQENRRLEAIVGHLLINAVGQTIHTVWTSDLDALMGGVLLLEENDHAQTVLQFTALPRGGAR